MKKLVLILVCLVTVFDCFGGIEPPKVVLFTDDIATTGIKVGNVQTNNDGVVLSNNNSYLTAYNLYKNKKVQNTVLLEINNDAIDAANCQVQAFSVKVDYSLRRYNPTLSTAILSTGSLNIEYDPTKGIHYKEKDFEVLYGGNWLELTITSVTGTTPAGVSLGSMLKYVNLKTIIDIERYKSLPTLDASDFSLHTNSTPLNANNEIEFVWDYNQDVEGYDFEYVFIDDYAYSSSSTPVYKSYADVLALLDFNNNATRISLPQYTSNPKIAISNIFEHGYLFCRVRATGKVGANFDVTTATVWSTVCSYQITSPHEPNLNWQYSATYAEDAKKKEVISYFDGSLHNRQSVTRINTDGVVTVGENYYDFMGRVAVTALPVPVNNNILKYYPDFNVNNNGDAYSKADFDVSSNCDASAAPMKTTSGSSNYYSYNNVFVRSGVITTSNYKYIPDAEGYPFAQIKYMADNSGRIIAQSGVGSNHKLGSGHETKIGYSHPSQAELDELFGNNVGFHQYYDKTVTYDANGQASISISNLSGKIIATGLDGNNPSNLQALPSQSTASRTDVTNLINPEDQLLNMDEMTNRHFFDISKPNETVLINYHFTPVEYSQCSLACADCEYNWEIALYDNCNPVAIYTELIHLGKISACNSTNQDLVNWSKQFTLGIGQYTLIKKLSIDKEAIHLAAKDYVKRFTEVDIPNNCILPYSYFLEKEMAKVDSDACFEIDCKECLRRIGTKPNYVTKRQNDYIAENGITAWNTNNAGNALILQFEVEYDNEKVECDQLCDSSSISCEGMLDAMKADFRPEGQYSTYDFDDATEVYTSSDKFSILNLGSNNVNGKYTDFNFNYNGQEIKVLVNGVLRNPNTLSLKEYVENFDESWLDYLVQKHPEYCKYTRCTNRSSSNEFDQLMLNTNTYKEALERNLWNTIDGLYTPTGLVTTTNLLDPYFATLGSGNPLKFAMVGALNNVENSGLKIWELMVKTYCYSNTYYTNAQIISIVDTFKWDDTCYVFKDLMWNMYKAFYQSTKASIIENYENSLSPACPIDDTKINKPLFAKREDQKTNANTVKDNLKLKSDHACEFYADQWMEKLKDCNLTVTQAANIRAELINVCNLGLDDNNPFGSSSVATQYLSAPTSVVPYKNFREVIYHFTTVIPNLCDPNMIGFPMDYNHDYYADKDTCVCNDTLFPCGKKQFADCGCDNNNPDATRNYGLQAAIITSAPDSIKCQNCKTCYQIKDALVNYADKYYINNSNSTFMKVRDTAYVDEEMIENLLNRYLGFNLTYEEYLVFARRCTNTDDSISVETISTDAVWELLRNKAINSTDWSRNDYIESESIYKDYVYLPQFNPFIYGAKATKNNHGGWAISKTSIFNKSLKNLDVQTTNTLAPTPPPPSTVPLDVCICTKIMMARDAYDILLANGGTTLSFANYWVSIGNCEFTPTKLALLEKTCRDAFIHDTKPNYVWSTISKGALRAKVFGPEMDNLLLDPSCACSTGGTNTGGMTPTRIYPTCEENLQKMSQYEELIRKSLPSGLDGKFIYNDDFFKKLSTYLNQQFTTTYGSGFEAFTPAYYFSRLQACGYNWQFGAPCNGKTPLCGCDTASTFIPLVQRFLDTLTYNKVYQTNFSDNTALFSFSDWQLLKDMLSQNIKTYINSSLYNNSTCSNYLKFYIDENYDFPDYKFVINDIYTSCNHTRTFEMYVPQDPGKYFFLEYIDHIYDLQLSRIGNCPTKFVTGKADIWYKVSGGGFTLRTGVIITLHFPDDEVTKPKACPPPKLLCNKPLFQADLEETCIEEQVRIAEHFAAINYQKYLDSVETAFYNSMLNKCRTAFPSETYTKSTNRYTHHFTLYYYDQAGNLVKTVPPAGVAMLNNTQITQCQNYRNDHSVIPVYSPIYNSHNLKTEYKYNSLNQLVWQQTPDGGKSTFFYDRLGRLVVSQNARQEPNNSYSYTIFDKLGRIIEVGQLSSIPPIGSMTNTLAFDTINLAAWYDTYNSNKEQITKTYYDTKISSQTLMLTFFNSGEQRYLRKRVAASCFYPTSSSLPTSTSNIGTPRHASYYSYDIFGNVDELVQYNGALHEALGNTTPTAAMAYKKLDYKFDLISGKVNQVDYQNYKQDHWSHRYAYDADNRLTEASTSANGFLWEREAGYEYFLHGPLMRTQLGSRKVQGIDYAYTLQGWIKGTNSQTLQSNRDIGKDGLTTHSTVAKDVFGYTLSYFASDYKAIDNSVISQNDNFIAQSTALDALSPDLWNGNIKNSVTALSKFDICHDPCIPIELKNATTNAVVYSNCIPPNANFNETITIGCASVQITYTTGDTHVIIASTENGSTVNYTITHTGGTATIATTTPALSCTTAQFVLGHNDGNKANIYWDDYDGTIATATLPITSTNTLNKIMNNCPVTASAKWDPQPTTTIELASHYGSNTGSSASLLAQYPWVSFNIPATPGGGWTPPITGLVKIHLDHVSASGFDFLINEAGTPLSATVVAGSGTTYVTGSSFGMFLEHVSSSKVVNCYMNLGGTDYKVATYSISAGSVGFAADLDISNCTVTDLVNIELIDVTTSSYVFEFYENGSTLVNISVPKNLPSTNSYFEKCGSYTLDFTYNSTLSGFDIVVQSSGGGTQTMVEAFLPINKANITLPTNGCFNIIATIPSNNSATPITPLPMAAVYNYDQLNRIKSADYTQDINLSTNQWTATGTMASYHNDYTYDANGNILTLNRKGIACKNLEMDKLHYNYYSNTNQLKYVWDEVADGNYSNDIDDQTSQFNTSGYNYKYDEIGNLIEDKKEGITSIQWNVYGKIQSVTKNTGLRLEFEYDPTGNRVVKRKLNLVSNTYVLQSTEFYVRDASGNVMANYTYTVAESALTWTESPIYGSSRIGVYRPNKTITDNINIDPCCFAYVRGERNYELTNHLGNVQAVITDKKIQVCSSGTVYFEADILTETDYYPFGMVMPERSYNSEGYRYGYNGKEQIAEIFGETNCISFELRVFDTRVGRFLSTDPRKSEYAWQSTYSYFKNCPVSIIDFLGGGSTSRHLDPDGKVIAEYNDGDNNIYKHQTARTKAQVDMWRKKFNNNSGNGVKVGTIPLIATKANTCAGCTPNNSDHTVINVNTKVIKPNPDNSNLPNHVEQASISVSPPSFAKTGFNSQQALNDFCYRCYQVNQFNPLANVANGISIYATGNDTYGVPQSNTEATTQLIMAIPISKLGNTGTVIAKSLFEEMAMEAVMKNPGIGTVIMQNMGDPRWLGWSKMEYKVKSAENVNAVIHYVGLWKDGVLIAVDDFKFK